MAKITVFKETNTLKVLSFLVSQPEKEFIGSDVQAGTHLSRSGVYFALQALTRQGLLSSRRRAKMHLYSLRNDTAVVRQFKVMTTTVLLSNLVEQLKPVARKIILFGSASRGEDISTSDIDLFVLCKDTMAARKIVESSKPPRKIQPVLLTAAEYSEVKEKDKVFVAEAERGICLWEETA
jgi:predicted nucleotidyltransferase